MIPAVTEFLIIWDQSN